jgi:hypothetical protein
MAAGKGHQAIDLLRGVDAASFHRLRARPPGLLGLAALVSRCYAEPANRAIRARIR